MDKTVQSRDQEGSNSSNTDYHKLKPYLYPNVAGNIDWATDVELVTEVYSQGRTVCVVHVCRDKNAHVDLEDKSSVIHY